MKLPILHNNPRQGVYQTQLLSDTSRCFFRVFVKDWITQEKHIQLVDIMSGELLDTLILDRYTQISVDLPDTVTILEMPIESGVPQHRLSRLTAQHGKIHKQPLGEFGRWFDDVVLTLHAVGSFGLKAFTRGQRHSNGCQYFICECYPTGGKLSSVICVIRDDGVIEKCCELSTGRFLSVTALPGSIGVSQNTDAMYIVDRLDGMVLLTLFDGCLVGEYGLPDTDATELSQGIGFNHDVLYTAKNDGGDVAVHTVKMDAVTPNFTTALLGVAPVVSLLYDGDCRIPITQSMDGKLLTFQGEVLEPESPIPLSPMTVVIRNEMNPSGVIFVL